MNPEFSCAYSVNLGHFGVRRKAVPVARKKFGRCEIARVKIMEV
jgi:hypothetical protein